LASQAYNTLGTEQTLQATDTQTIGSKIVNETRFQYLRDETNAMAQNSSPTIDVLGAFEAAGRL